MFFNAISKKRSSPSELLTFRYFPRKAMRSLKKKVFAFRTSYFSLISYLFPKRPPSFCLGLFHWLFAGRKSRVGNLRGHDPGALATPLRTMNFCESSKNIGLSTKEPRMLRIIDLKLLLCCTRLVVLNSNTLKKAIV